MAAVSVAKVALRSIGITGQLQKATLATLISILFELKRDRGESSQGVLKKKNIRELA